MNRHRFLTAFGRMKLAIGEKLAVAEQKFDWNDAVCDSAILAGMTFFAALGGSALSGGEGNQPIIAAFVAAGSMFFGTLALKRGLIRKDGRA